jgi:hypothetical protein
MNEVADSMLEQEKAVARAATQGAFKIVVPLASVSAQSLAVSCKLVLGLTNGFKDLAIDGINTARASPGKGKTRSNTKHQHIVGSGSSYKNINKTAKKKGATLENIEVSDKSVLGFETVARQYGIEYGLKKNEATSPPTWQVYFMAKDRATMSQAFKDFTNRQLSNTKETPLEQFKRMASRVADHVKPEKIMRQTGQQL